MNIVLVGNGPSAVDRLLGKEIDAHDLVVRFNNFILNGYEDFIGRRTDVHAVNEGMLFGGIEDRGLPVLMAVPWTKDTNPCLWQRMDYLMPPGWDLICEEVARAFDRCTTKWPSTGLLTLLHYAAIGHSVSLVGFDCFQSGRHHYGDGDLFCGCHDPSIEGMSVGDLVDAGFARML